MLPGRKARPPPSSPAPWRLRQQGVRADGAHAIHLLRRAAGHAARRRILARIGTICDEFECYGYRRVGAALRHQGLVVNGKKLRRLMREHDLQPKQRRRYVVTTDSDHAGPIYPDLAKDCRPDRPNQLWVADLTYVAIPAASSTWLPSWMPGRARSSATPSAAPWMPASPSRRLKAAIRNRSPQRLHSPLRSRVAIRVGGVSQLAGRPWPERLDEPPRQPVR